MTGIDTTFLIDLEITDSPRHKAALKIFNEWRSKKHSILAVYNQTFLEFMNVVTDAKRFNNPLTMEQAVQRCWFWMDQERIKVVYPDDNSLKRAQLWISMHKLGRKRIQDTHMASAFASNGVSEIITANPDDFRIFDAFDLSEY